MKRRGWLLVIGLWLVVEGAAIAQGLTGMTIVIDPGHGGNDPANDRRIEPDPGNVLWESESNFQKALLLKPLLEARGAVVVLTRTTNSYPAGDEPSLSARVAVANENNANWFHSIHSNAFNASTNYTLVLVRERRSTGTPSYDSTAGFGVPEWQESNDFSAILSPRIRSVLRTTTSYVRLDYSFTFSLGVLRGLLMPGELSEGSFHDVPAEARRLLNNSYRKMEAYAIAWSFQQYFGAPSDEVGLIAGIVTDSETGLPKNQAIVRLQTGSRTFQGDAYNNGFFLFDSVAPGTHWVRFENAGYVVDSVQVSVTAAVPTFVDHTIYMLATPYVVSSSPTSADTAYPQIAPLRVTFSRAMDTASVRNAITISPPAPGKLFWTAPNPNQSMYYDPYDPLEPGTIYTLRIDTTAKSVAGEPLDATKSGSSNPFIVQFRTAGTTNVRDEQNTPSSFGLRQNFPNPFNPTTTLTVELPHRATGSLVVVDAVGREVARLFSGELEAGIRVFTFDASGLPSGVYFCILQTAEFRSAVKLMLLK